MGITYQTLLKDQLYINPYEFLQYTEEINGQQVITKASLVAHRPMGVIIAMFYMGNITFDSETNYSKADLDYMFTTAYGETLEFPQNWFDLLDSIRGDTPGYVLGLDLIEILSNDSIILLNGDIWLIQYAMYDSSGNFTLEDISNQYGYGVAYLVEYIFEYLDSDDDGYLVPADVISYYAENFKMSLLLLMLLNEIVNPVEIFTISYNALNGFWESEYSTTMPKEFFVKNMNFGRLVIPFAGNVYLNYDFLMDLQETGENGENIYITTDEVILTMFEKNVEVIGFSFNLLNKTTGEDITSGTVNCYYMIDGGGEGFEGQFGTGGDVPVYNSTSKCWKVDVPQTVMNGDVIGLTFKHTDSITKSYTIKTTTSSESGGATPAEIWGYETRALTDKTGFTLHADYNASKTAASQTSVDTIDGIVDAIKAKTDNLPADPASNTQVNTRLAGSSYTAPDNASISSIKTKTDGLNFSGTDVKATLDGETVAVSSIGNDVITAASIAEGAITEIQTGLATEYTTGIIDGKVDDIVSALDGVGEVFIPIAQNSEKFGTMVEETESESGIYKFKSTAFGDIELGGGATIEEITGLFGPIYSTLEETLTPDVYRFTEASLFNAPSGEGGGATPAQIWGYETRALTDKAGFTLHADYDAAKTAASQASVDTIDGIVDNIKLVTDKIDTTLELDGAVYKFTENSLENSPTGTGGFSETDRENLETVVNFSEKFDTLLEEDNNLYQFTENALINSPVGEGGFTNTDRDNITDIKTQTNKMEFNDENRILADAEVSGTTNKKFTY